METEPVPVRDHHDAIVINSLFDYVTARRDNIPREHWLYLGQNEPKELIHVLAHLNIDMNEKSDQFRRYKQLETFAYRALGRDRIVNKDEKSTEYQIFLKEAEQQRRSKLREINK